MTRLCTLASQVSPSLRKIEWITFSTDLSVRKSASAIAALFLPAAIACSTSRSRGVSWLSGDSSAAIALRHERLDDLRIDHRTAVGDCANRSGQLLEILHPLLEEVSAPSAAPLEQGAREGRVRVLAEHDDANVGVRLAQTLGCLDPFVDVARRHTDVRHDDVRPLRLDRREQRAEVSAHRGDLEVRQRLEQAPKSLPDEVVVLSDDQPYRHERRIRR